MSHQPISQRDPTDPLVHQMVASANAQLLASSLSSRQRPTLWTVESFLDFHRVLEAARLVTSAVLTHEPTRTPGLPAPPPVPDQPAPATWWQRCWAWCQHAWRIFAYGPADAY